MTDQQTTHLLMLLEQVVQIVTSLVIEIEILALRLTFGAHHFGNGCPVPSMLNEPLWRTKRGNSAFMIGCNLSKFNSTHTNTPEIIMYDDMS